MSETLEEGSWMEAYQSKIVRVIVAGTRYFNDVEYIVPI